MDANHFSKVVYAGTSGTGPLATGLPTGGHIWVSKDAGGGDFLWSDQTGSINPNHFPISAIVIDGSDLSGLTAYAGIMGFGGSHVWKTTSGGASWMDFTGNLPDAPVNALLVDNQPGSPASVLYAATDVGVFSSDSVVSNWTEVGPAPNSGKPGYLPNVAVTALHIFSPATGRRLRASTYGRGLWELAGFNLGRPVPETVTISAPGSSKQVKLQLTAASFSGQVNLSCIVPSWLQCNFVGGGSTLSIGVDPRNPVTVTLALTAAAIAPSGPITVGIHAAAPGFTTQTQNLPVTITGGFTFSIVNTSGSPTVAPGQTASYSLNIVPSGGTFPAAVTLSFSGCPTASVCSLSASQVAAGSAGTSVILSVATALSTPPAVYSSISVSGSSGLSLNARVKLSLTVQTGAFSFSMSNSGPATITAGSSAQYDITVKPSAGTFPDTVAITFTGCPAASTCTLSAMQVSAGSVTTNVSLTVATVAAGAGVAGTPIGSYTIALNGRSGSLMANTAISFTVQAAGFSFSMSSSGPATIKVGSSAKYDIMVTPSFGTFPNPVALAFTGCPAVSTCSPSATDVAAGSGTTDVTLTISTTAPALGSSQGRALLYGWLCPLAVIAGILSCQSRRRLSTLMTLLIVALCAGCGGLQGGSAAPAGNPCTPVGVYTVKVIGTSGSLTASTTISLTVQTGQ